MYICVYVYVNNKGQIYTETETHIHTDIHACMHAYIQVSEDLLDYAIKRFDEKKQKYTHKHTHMHACIHPGI
jgi:hypothetical protein